MHNRNHCPANVLQIVYKWVSRMHLPRSNKSSLYVRVSVSKLLDPTSILKTCGSFLAEESYKQAAWAAYHIGLFEVK